MRVRNTVNLHCIKMAHWTIVGSKNKQANNPITLNKNILIRYKIYKTSVKNTDRPIKRKLISTAISTLLPHKQISGSRKTSVIRAKQK